MSASGDADGSARVVEDIAPHGVDGREVHPRFVRAIAHGAPDAPIDGLALWPADAIRTTDVHAGFLGRFRLQRDSDVELQFLAVDVYRAWLDGERVADGPRRFAADAPTCEVVRVQLAAGEHLLAVHVHGFGVTTRMLARIEPFLWARVLVDGKPLTLEWRAAQLAGYWDTKVRVSDLLGWIEWSDTRVDGPWWTGETDTSGWTAPVRRTPRLGPIVAVRAPVPLRELRLEEPLAAGRYRERRALMSFPGYELDNPTIQFATTDLDPPADERADGRWRRWDLGRVRSGTLRLRLDGRAGTEVLIGSAERLFADRLIPFVAPGRSCFVTRFVLRDGVQEVEPLCVNGAEFVEVRIGDDGDTRLLEATFVERDGLGEPVGSFTCGDEELERIWATGIETIRAAAGDALIDCIRERAQWTGDALTVGLEVTAVGWNDLSLLRQAMLQSAECADHEGLVGGCTPGDVIYLSTFAAYWTSAGVRYAELSGDLDLLRELLPAARANVAALRRRTAPDGTLQDAPWPFVDWGHTVIDGAPDPAVLAIYLAAANDLRRWEGLLGEHDATGAQAWADDLTGLVSELLPKGGGLAPWTAFGYHATIWALRCGLVGRSDRAAAVASLKAHLLRCFPNDPEAPRLRDPSFRDARVITPFYGHFALAALLEAGEVDFVIEQWKSCWGWMIDRGARTWWEVFDEGWSHGHFWSSSPTWQMTRHLLGIRTRWDRGAGEVDLDLNPGSLSRASGTIALPGGRVAVAWQRRGDTIVWRATPTIPLALAHAGERREIAANASLELTLETR